MGLARTVETHCVLAASLQHVLNDIFIAAAFALRARWTELEQRHLRQARPEAARERIRYTDLR